MANPLPPDKRKPLTFGSQGEMPITFYSRFLIKFPPEMTRADRASIDIGDV
jgi:hypothetical protein